MASRFLGLSLAIGLAVLGAGCGNNADLCEIVHVHMLYTVVDVPSDDEDGVAAEGRALMRLYTQLNAHKCRTQGSLTREQAKCLLAARSFDDLIHDARRCPALATDPPEWLVLPTDDEVRRYEETSATETGELQGPVGFGEGDQ